MATRKVSLILLGLTGSGKSATGNTILGEEKFLSKRSMMPTTNAAQEATSHMTVAAVGRETIEITVIDTPPLLNPNHKDLTPSEVVSEIRRGTDFAGAGLDAIVLTINANDRMTKEHVDSIQWLYFLFGETNIAKYGIVLFTRLDQLDADDMHFEDFRKEVPKCVSDLIEKCDNRCIAFDNTIKSAERIPTPQVSQLIETIVKIKDTHNGEPCKLPDIGNQVSRVVDLEQGCRLVENESDGFVVVEYVYSAVDFVYRGVIGMWDTLSVALWRVLGYDVDG